MYRVAQEALTNITKHACPVQDFTRDGVPPRAAGDSPGYGTVKSHVNHLLPKIDARDRAQAVAYAYQHGLATPREQAS